MYICAAGGGLATAAGLAMTNRDFGPEDYDALLALDERVEAKGTTKAALKGRTAVSTVPAAGTTAAGGRAGRGGGGGAAAGGGGGAAAAAVQDCAVCLEAPQPGEVVRTLGCPHAFHQDCIDKWLQRSTTCPVSKHAV